MRRIILTASHTRLTAVLCSLSFLGIPAGALAGPYDDLLATLDARDALAFERATPDPPRARQHLEEARRQLRFGTPQVALQNLRAAYKFGMERQRLDFHVGRTLVELGKPEHALLHLNHTLGENDGDGQAWCWAGKALGELGRDQASLEALETAYQCDPEYGETNFLLALHYDRLNDSPRVLQHSQAAIRADPGYKARLKPAIAEGGTSKKIGDIVDRVLEDSKQGRLSDEQIGKYADQLGEAGGR